MPASKGSRKERVRILWSEKHDDVAAYTLGKRLKLSPNSIRRWLLQWRTEEAKAKKKSRVTKSKPAKRPTQVIEAKAISA